jgi:carboxymethylenebutenolidase
MCHEPDARPPAPPLAGEVSASRTLTLKAADGTEFAAHEAVPAGDARAGVVVLPDVRGLHPYYVALTERLAEAGYRAVAIDYFGRTAGEEPRGEGFDHQPHVAQVTPDQVALDAGAALEHLAAEGQRSVFTLGFCFGGGQSWGLGAGPLAHHGPLAGVIGFYGRPPLLVERAADVAVPVLMLVAGDDRATPVAESLAAADAVRAHGGDVEVHVYEGAPHSFFDRSFADHAEACADAWTRILAFTDRVAG